MALHLKHDNEMLKVLGDLNSENAIILKSHFEKFLAETDNIILNLENVESIEPTGAFTVEQLYLDFIKSNKNLQVVGKTNESIAEVMKSTNTSYIFSDDRT